MVTQVYRTHGYRNSKGDYLATIKYELNPAADAIEELQGLCLIVQKTPITLGDLIYDDEDGQIHYNEVVPATKEEIRKILEMEERQKLSRRHQYELLKREFEDGN